MESNLIRVFFPDLEILLKVSLWIPFRSTKNSLYFEKPEGLSE